MRTIDFSPLYRSVVGFDRLQNLLETAGYEVIFTQSPRES